MDHFLGLTVTRWIACICSCATTRPYPAVDTAGWSAIVYARVLGVDDSGLFEWLRRRASPDSLPADSALIRATLQVERSWKGIESERAVYVWDGRVADSCDLILEPGRQYLLFASRDDAGRLRGSLCEAVPAAYLREALRNFHRRYGNGLQLRRAGGRTRPSAGSFGSVGGKSDLVMRASKSLEHTTPPNIEAERAQLMRPRSSIAQVVRRLRG